MMKGRLRLLKSESPARAVLEQRYNQALLKSIADTLIDFGPPAVLDVWLVTVAIESPALAVIGSVAGKRPAR